jgi:hypothetical protein
VPRSDAETDANDPDYDDLAFKVDLTELLYRESLNLTNAIDPRFYDDLEWRKLIPDEVRCVVKGGLILSFCFICYSLFSFPFKCV